MKRCVFKYPDVCGYTELINDEELAIAKKKIQEESLNPPRIVTLGDFIVLFPSGKYQSFDKKDFEKYFARG